MSNVNFNLQDSGKYPDIMFFNDVDGYGACINGKFMPIFNWDTVLGLRILGIPEIKIHHSDFNNFRKCVSSE